MTQQATFAEPIGNHDVSTTEGGRAYIAEYFEKRLLRRDFGQYIGEGLAADFACALAKHLQESKEEPVGFLHRQFRDNQSNQLGAITWKEESLFCVPVYLGAPAQAGQSLALERERADFERFREVGGAVFFKDDKYHPCGFTQYAKDVAEHLNLLWPVWKARAALDRPAEQPVPAAGPWIDGSPPSPWGSESFLAYTQHGDKVVLSPLPEEYSYDFQTADGTYMMRANIKKWAQLSTSQFIDYDGKAEQPLLASEPVVLSAAAVVREGDDGQYLDWLLEGGIAELEPGQVLIVADQDVTDDEGRGELYRLQQNDAVPQ